MGDAENDHAFLSRCEASVAVANALPMVQERADLVTEARAGDGVAELAEALLSDDLACLESRLTRQHIPLGTRQGGADAKVAPYGQNVLVAGPSSSGKSTLVRGLLERLADAAYQFCPSTPKVTTRASSSGWRWETASGRPPSTRSSTCWLIPPTTWW